MLSVLSGKIPGVVREISAGHNEGVPFMVIERLDNTLTQRLYGRLVQVHAYLTYVAKFGLTST